MLNVGKRRGGCNYLLLPSRHQYVRTYVRKYSVRMYRIRVVIVKGYQAGELHVLYGVSPEE